VDTGHGGARVEIGGLPDPLGAIHTALEALWTIHPHVPDGVRIQITIASVEVGANIVEHTSVDQPLQIGLRLELVNGQVHVAFTDNGPPVDIDLASVVMPDAMAERGRGLALARLAYRYDDVGNHWTLISQRFA
jgi:serine/threonine-protein kinase RsbW